MSQSGAEESTVEAALRRAEEARRQRRYNDGIALLVDALAHRVMTDAVYYRLGNIYYDAGDLRRAEYVWRRAVQLNPKHVNAHYNLAAVYKRTGRIAESIRMQKRAVRLQAIGRTGRLMGRYEGPPSVSTGESEMTVDELRAPVPEAAPESTGVPNPPSSPAPVEADASELTREELRDDPGFRKWSRYLLLQGIIFVTLVILLFLVLLYVVGARIF